MREQQSSLKKEESGFYPLFPRFVLSLYQPKTSPAFMPKMTTKYCEKCRMIYLEDETCLCKDKPNEQEQQEQIQKIKSSKYKKRKRYSVKKERQLQLK